MSVGRDGLLTCSSLWVFIDFIGIGLNLFEYFCPSPFVALSSNCLFLLSATGL